MHNHFSLIVCLAYLVVLFFYDYWNFKRWLEQCGCHCSRNRLIKYSSYFGIERPFENNFRIYWTFSCIFKSPPLCKCRTLEYVLGYGVITLWNSARYFAFVLWFWFHNPFRLQAAMWFALLSVSVMFATRGDMLLASYKTEHEESMPLRRQPMPRLDAVPEPTSFV